MLVKVLNQLGRHVAVKPSNMKLVPEHDAVALPPRVKPAAQLNVTVWPAG